MPTRGGQKFRRFILNAKRAQAAGGVRAVRVGFFQDAKYPDGTPVTNVAAWNEFGTKRKDGTTHSPPRPFMSNVLDRAEDAVREIVKREVDPKTLVVSRGTADRIGLTVQGMIQKEIVDLRSPPNAPSTIRRKKSDNPLVDTGLMRLSTSYQVID